MNITLRTTTLGMVFAIATLTGCSTLSSKNGDSGTASGPLAADLGNEGTEINSVSEPVCSPAELSTLAAVLASADQKSAIKQTVFLFGTDKSDLQPDTLGVLTAHAALLKQQSTLRLKVAGHTDERGTADYNLALGERRANTVATFLIAAGVKSPQMRVVSFGEEKPAVSGNDEAAWAKNRRAELSYTGCAK
ncbi:MAG: peptidoglycan-associated lipoprotein Pal [Pseudomonadota bacterium]|mgnify:CR=1 FL=1